jgi:hypothetical protein
MDSDVLWECLDRLRSSLAAILPWRSRVPAHRLCLLCVLAGVPWPTQALAQPTVVLAEGTSLEESLGSLVDRFDIAGPLLTLIRLEVSTMPLGTSSGAFTSLFDRNTDTVSYVSSTFGPVFTDRAFTTGKHRGVIGLNYLTARYSSLGGYSLNSLELLRNVTGHPDRLGSTVASVHIEADTAVAFAHYGIADRLDAGAAVPWVSVRVHGANRHFYETGSLAWMKVLMPTSSSGLGDVALFAKYRLSKAPYERRGAMAAALTTEIRLPTGETESLRGLGVTRTLVSFVTTSSFRGWSLHTTEGIELWSRGVPVSKFADYNAKNRVRLAAGLEGRSHRKATVLLDAIFTALVEGTHVQYFHFSPAGTQIEEDELVAFSQGTAKFDIVPGIRWAPRERLLISANLLVSLYNAGLRARVIPALGVEWSFGRGGQSRARVARITQDDPRLASVK